jgi:hypothetical protein
MFKKRWFPFLGALAKASTCKRSLSSSIGLLRAKTAQIGLGAAKMAMPIPQHHQCHIRGLWADLAGVVMSRKGGSTFFPFPAFFRCCRAPGQCSKKGGFPFWGRWPKRARASALSSPIALPACQNRSDRPRSRKDGHANTHPCQCHIRGL